MVEFLDDDFLRHFWDFVRRGGYETRQRSDGRRAYYRFSRPRAADYPEMLEIFSRSPVGLSLADGQTIVPIPAQEDASSLSAILMDDDYYRIISDFRKVSSTLPLITPPGIILLKARAWLDLEARRHAGEPVDGKHVRKHRNDVFRLARLLSQDERHVVPRRVFEDFRRFLAQHPEGSSEWGAIRASVGSDPPLPPVAAVLELLERAFSAAD